MKTRLTDLIQIGEWLPDRPENNNPGANNVQNVIVQGESYKPFKKFSAATGVVSTSERVIGAFSFIDDEGNVSNFAGTASELYRAVGSTWSNVSVSSTSTATYATASDKQWRFTSFDQRIITTNLADEIQSYVVGTSTSFTALTTSATIKAKDVTVLNDSFVVAVYIDQDGTVYPNRVKWSALNDPTDWSASATTLSDFQDLSDEGGECQRIVATQNYGLIIRSNSIVRMEFIGAPAIFRFDTAEKNRGTQAVNSVVTDGVFVFYLDEDGFYMFDGTRSIPIGDNKVDRYFLDKLDDQRLELVKGAIDPINKFVIWGYKDANKNGFITDMIMYHWTENRWSQAVSDLDLIETMNSPGYTLEGLDAISTSLDALEYSLDSRVWQGGKRTLAGFSTDHKLGFFEGMNKKATLESAETMINPGGRAYVSSVLPVTDSTSVQARIKHRTNQNGTLTATSSATYNIATNEIPFRIDDRYMRAEFTIAEGSTWELFQGFRFRAKRSGAR